MNNTLVPLRKVVAAATIDTHEELNKIEQVYSHWAARGLRMLSAETLKMGKRYVFLTVNKNTQTATLPPDVQRVLFVGLIDNRGMKIPLSYKGDLALHKEHIDELSGIDCCVKCNQDKSICNDLQVTEEVNFITINNVAYEESIIKKLYPNGDYFLEKNTPVLDLQTNGVAYVKTKEFITNLDLMDCGCLERTEDNMHKLFQSCPDTYACYYAGCCNDCDPELGGYRVYEDQGLIQFDLKFRANKVYVEYEGFLPKIHGQYQVPEVAFETLVDYVKFKSIENKRNVPMIERHWVFENYRRSRGKMEQVNGRFTLSRILEIANSVPKFDLNLPRWYDCYERNKMYSKTRQPSAYIDKMGDRTEVTSIVRTDEDTMVFEKIKFEIGIAGALMGAGDTQVTIVDGRIKEKSVNVMIGMQPIDEVDDTTTVTDELVYSVEYFANQIIITFNSPAMTGQKFTISYAKTV